MTVLIIFLILLGLAILVIVLGTKEVPPVYQGVIIRLGRRRKFVSEGLCFVIPLLERLQTVYVGMKTTDLPRETFYLKDKTWVNVWPRVIWEVADARITLAIKEEEREKAIRGLVYSTLRVTLQEYNLETLEKVGWEAIRKEWMAKLEEEFKKLGLRVVTARIQDWEYPEEVREAMQNRVQAEFEKQRKIIEAEAAQRAVEIEAQAQANQIRIISEKAGISADVAARYIAFLKYVKALETIGASEAARVVPAEMGGPAGLLDAVTSFLRR